ncbi:MAG TPA: hypothetical protein VJ850_14715 [Candidatus Limnocylindrales bacterium]|nr:hypothetical protein [Candidatus Limnocylindrales bacterium]
MTIDSVAPADPPRVVGLALRARVLASIRAGLSILGAVAAVLVGVTPETVLLGWAVGAVMVSMILAGDRRGRRDSAPEPLPAGSIPESWAEIARIDIIPSTVGVATFTVVSLAFNAALAGIMAGILGGMALMTIVFWVQVAWAERKLRGDLFVERETRRLYIRDARPSGPAMSRA